MPLRLNPSPRGIATNSPETADTRIWIIGRLTSVERLRVDELYHVGEIGFAHSSKDNVPTTETLLACCQRLSVPDKGASAAQLIQHAFRKYPSTHLNLFTRAHSVMAETFLAYLNSYQAKAIPAKRQPDL